jgi:RNA polymerase sigma factor (sigma-70 family)
LPQHERDLVIATEAGDEAACRELVHAFLPAIGAIARRYELGAGVDRRELVQEGVVGLLRAASRYEPRLDTPFWAYASWWVRQSMQQLISEVTRPVVLSDRAQRGIARINAARRDHMQEHGTEPTGRELAAATGFAPEQVDSLLAIEMTPRALEELAASDDSGTATTGQTIPDPGAEAQYELVLDRMEVQSVRDLTTVLDDRERTVLASHYGLGGPPQTLSKIGSDLALSAERVRQIEAEALQKLRDEAAKPRERGHVG